MMTPEQHKLVKKELYIYVGKVIALKRKIADVDQATLASAMEISRPSLSNWEVGRAHIPLHTICKLAQYFKCPVTDFMPTGTSVASNLDTLSNGHAYSQTKTGLG